MHNGCISPPPALSNQSTACAIVWPSKPLPTSGPCRGERLSPPLAGTRKPASPVTTTRLFPRPAGIVLTVLPSRHIILSSPSSPSLDQPPVFRHQGSGSRHNEEHHNGRTPSPYLSNRGREESGPGCNNKPGGSKAQPGKAPGAEGGTKIPADVTEKSVAQFKHNNDKNKHANHWSNGGLANVSLKLQLDKYFHENH